MPHRCMPPTLILTLLALLGCVPAAPAHDPVNPAVAADVRPAEIPTRAEFDQMLRKQHPRLLMTRASLASLLDRVDQEPLDDWALRAKRHSESLMAVAPVEYDIYDGVRLLRISREAVKRVHLLVMAHHLSGRQVRYRDRLWDEIEAITSFPDWNPSHFLDTAEMTHAVAIAYDWLYDDWSVSQRARMREAIIEKGLKPGLAAHRPAEGKPAWWTTTTNNWNPVCHAGLTLGALAIADDEPDLAYDVLTLALTSVPISMAEYAPDGGWIEGPGYWGYATRYAVLLVAALETALGSDCGLADAPGFRQTGDFPIHMTGPTGRYANFGDGGDSPTPAPELFWLGRLSGNPLYTSYQLERARGTTRDMLWYSDTVDSDGLSAQPRDRLFKRINVATMRSGWLDPQALFVAVKGGDNDASHAQLDLGTFVIDALGQRWATDFGGDDYNLPGYFSDDKRWTYFRLRAEGHNTLVLNPGLDGGQDPAATAAIVGFHTEEGEARAIVDLAAAYGDRVKRCQRGVALYDNRRRVLIQDEIEAGRKPVDLVWSFHTHAAIEIDDDGRGATLAIDDHRARVTIVAPADAAFSVRPVGAMPTSPQPRGEESNEGVRTLMIAIDDCSTTTLAVVFTPVIGDEVQAPDDAVTPLASWRTGRVAPSE